MKFFHPQVQLAREIVLDELDVYYLHIVTFCPRSNFRADGYEVDDSELADGRFKVRIKLLQDPSLPDFEYITPVVHTLDLGIIDFPDGDGDIEVTVVGDVLVGASGSISRSVDPPPTTTKTGGTTTVGTTGSDGKTKPIDSDSLFSNF